MCSLDKKTLLIGLDAACWDYLDPLLQADRLPALRKIIDAGNGGILKSTLPAMTPTAWSTLITGKNPGKHGVFEMMWRKPGGYDFVPTSAGSRQGTPFWKYLNDAGIRVGLVNIPFTHPPTPVDGFMLCGFGAPETARDLTWPPEALEWVDNGAEPYRPAVSTELLRSGRPEKILEAEVSISIPSRWSDMELMMKLLPESTVSWCRVALANGAAKGRLRRFAMPASRKFPSSASVSACRWRWWNSPAMSAAWKGRIPPSSTKMPRTR
jgi:hypothetical protein